MAVMSRLQKRLALRIRNEMAVGAKPHNIARVIADYLADLPEGEMRELVADHYWALEDMRERGEGL